MRERVEILAAPLVSENHELEREFEAQLSEGSTLAFRVAYSVLRHTQDAEDVAQDVCVRLAGAIRSFRGQGRFRTWLYAMVLNAVRDLARKSVRERRKAEEWNQDQIGRAHV